MLILSAGITNLCSQETLPSRLELSEYPFPTPLR